MDIKLKNNKKTNLIVAAVIVALFAAGFMAMYPVFEKKAAAYEEDGLQSENFLAKIYQSNYILYKDVVEKAKESSVSYSDLYIDIQEEYATEEQGEGWNAEIDYIIGDMKEEVENRLSSWEEEVMYGIAQAADYCVIDKATGKMVKNTGKNIELLSEPLENTVKEREALPYVYYVKIEYDSVGNIGNVAVKGRDSDGLLKKVQSAMKSRWLENSLPYAGNSYYEYKGDDMGDIRKVSFRLNLPKDVTFIYALTETQQSDILRSGELIDWWGNGEGAYWQAGVVDIYIIMLLVMAALGFILFRFKGYTLHKAEGFRPHLEFILIAGMFIMAAFSESVVGLVNMTNRGLFNAGYAEYLPFVPADMYPVLTGAINFIFLFLLFGIWFYCVNALGEALVLGIGGYIKERSLCVKFLARIRDFGRKHIRAFKDEVLHVNLAEETGKTIRKAVIVNFLILAAICSVWFFGWMVLVIYSVILYFMLKKYVGRIQAQYRKLLEVTGSIAEGNLHTSFDEDLGVFESYKEELYRIQEGFRRAVDEEVKSQRMKAELITNVSHDLKTPLTAITTYVDLLKEEGVTEKQREEYLAVLEKKSLRLKFLIEDLFEVSKANSKNVTLNLVDVDICHLMRQVYLEYENKVEEADLIFRFRIPEEKTVLKLDSQKTYRIFENLYTNIIKYAMPHTRVYINADKTDNGIRIEMKNMSAQELNVDPHELTERFVRGDSARNTEGSGLGLAIAQSFTELQGGKLEVGIDGDLFKVTLEWL